MKKNLLRYVPFFLLIAIIVVGYFLDVTSYLSFDKIKENRNQLLLFAKQRPILTPLIFMTLYTVAVSLSIPGAFILTIVSGFIFYLPLSIFYVAISATLGAYVIFLIAKYAFSSLMQDKAKPLLKKFEKGFQENGASYLLFLRLIPLFPFWFVNIAPAFFNIKTRTFLWTTFVGILPGVFVYANAGRSLGTIFDQGKEFSLETVFNFQVKLALVILALFALVPILIKKYSGKKDA